MSSATRENKTRPALPATFLPTQFLAGAMVISLGPLLDSILRDLNVPLAYGGVLSLGFALGRVGGVILLNSGLARVPLKTVIVGSAWIMAAGLVLSALLSKGLWTLFAGLVLTGVPVVLPNAISGIWASAHMRGTAERAMLTIAASFGLGVVITPLVIGAALDLGATWRWVLLGLAGSAGVMALMLTIAPLQDVSGRQNLRTLQLQQVVKSNPRLLAAMLTATFMYVATEITMSVWLAKLHVDSFDAGPTLAALSVTLFWTGITLGRYLAIPLTRRVSPSRLLAAFAATFAVFGVGVVLAPTLALSEVSCFFAGLGGSACFPIIAGYTSRFPGWYSGVVFSGMMLVGTAASTIFPFLVGPVAQALGLKTAVGLSVVPLAVVVVLAFVLQHVSGDGTSANQDRQSSMVL